MFVGHGAVTRDGGPQIGQKHVLDRPKVRKTPVVYKADGILNVLEPEVSA
jgi:hypothetical protein